MVCHLYDEAREDFRKQLDFILHRQPESYHAINPPAFTERHYHQQDPAELTQKFFGERAQSLEWLLGQRELDWDTTSRSDLGSPTAGELLASWVAHDNLHIRQLVELRRRHIERITQPYPIQYAGDR